MRQLKFHEKKLLKKVDFFDWKADRNVREASIIRRYLLLDREDYTKYSKIVGHITSLCSKLANLPQNDPLRKQLSEGMLEKLCSMGIISNTSSLIAVEKLTVSSFCRRRLPVLMVRLKMSETLKEATTFIQQGLFSFKQTF